MHAAKDAYEKCLEIRAGQLGEEHELVQKAVKALRRVQAAETTAVATPPGRISKMLSSAVNSIRRASSSAIGAMPEDPPSSDVMVSGDNTLPVLDPSAVVVDQDTNTAGRSTPGESANNGRDSAQSTQSEAPLPPRGPS